MKFKLFVFCLVLGVVAEAQPGYTTINSRYSWLGGRFTGGLHVPGYNGVPSDITGVWIGDGAVAVDTANGYFYWRVGGVWIKGAKFSDITGTMSSFSSGNLSPLFTTSVADPTTTPALSFTLSTQTANRVFAGPASGSAAAPTFRALVGLDIPWGGIVTSNGVLLGNSTIAAYSCGDGVEEFLMTTADSAVNTTITNDAVAGHTIAQQRAVWEADADRATYDWIVVEIGLNDLDPAESAATALGRYQTLIDTINAQKKSTAVVIVSAMIPCRSRLIDLYGGTNGPIAYQKWLDMNNAIMGGQPNRITGVNYRVNEHTISLNDGSGNLITTYDCGDGIHPTNDGRKIIASSWRKILTRLGYLNVTNPLPYGTSSASSITGTDTHVMFFDGTDNPAGEAGMVYNKTTNALTVDGEVRANSIKAYEATNTNYSVFTHSDLVGSASYPTAYFKIGKTGTNPTQATMIVSPGYTGGAAITNLEISNNYDALQGGSKQIFITNDGTNAMWRTFTASTTPNALKMAFGGTDATDAPLQINTDGKVVINEGAADADTRIEGDADANLVFVDAGADKVGIGTATPAHKFTVGSNSDFGVNTSGKVSEYANAAPTDGQILVGHTANGTFEKTTLTSTGSSITVTNGAGTINIETAKTLAEGTYTATLSNTTNVAASTPYEANYYRVGDRIYVFGEVDIDATATGAVELRMTLPVAAALTNTYDLAGTSVCGSSGVPVAISANAGTGTAAFKFIATTTTNDKYSFHFSYKYTAP